MHIPTLMRGAAVAPLLHCSTASVQTAASGFELERMELLTEQGVPQAHLRVRVPERRTRGWRTLSSRQLHDQAARLATLHPCSAQGRGGLARRAGDGALTFALAPGDHLAAPGFHPLQHLPAFIFVDDHREARELRAAGRGWIVTGVDDRPVPSGPPSLSATLNRAK